MKKRLNAAVLFLAVLGLGFAAGFWAPRNDDFFALRKNFQIFGALYEELVSGYVDPLDPEKLMRTGIEAMLEDLDPYTNFIDEADNTDIDIITRGHYGGVGLNIAVRNGKITVTSPIEGTSGYKQGVRAGDVVSRIAGQSAEGLSLSDVRQLMRGEPGTAIEIVVVREGEPEPLQFMLTREQVTLRNVTYSGFVNEDTAAGLGYVKLARFARDAGNEVRKAVQELQSTNRLQGLILDLRDNPGGLLDAAVEITQLFVPQGSVIVSTRGRGAQSDRVYRGKTPPIVPNLPLAILVNDLSASASEIVAGAVQDLDRGVVVGSTTFGKGLVQIIKPLPYNTSLKITTSKYFTPSGRSIQAIDYGKHDGNFATIPDSLLRTFRTQSGRQVRDGRGIEPDVAVAAGPKSELEQALDRRAAFFFYANHFAARHTEIPIDFTVTPDILSDFRSWLSGEDFAYRTSAERAVEALSKDFVAGGYSGVADEIAELQDAVRLEKERDFDRQAAHLMERLRSEILSRYFGESAQVAASFEHDPQVQEAARILRAQETYGLLLKQ